MIVVCVIFNIVYKKKNNYGNICLMYMYDWGIENNFYFNIGKCISRICIYFKREVIFVNEVMLNGKILE